MADPFILADPQGAQAFLRDFPETTRQKGDACYNAGGVADWESRVPGRGFVAQVTDTFSYTVTLFSHEPQGWDADCTCPVGHGCKHIYAAMRALLAEHSAALARNLSAGTVRPAGRVVVPVVEKAPPSFAEEVAQHLGRSLDAPERKFLAVLHRVYERACVTQHIMLWDLVPLGLFESRLIQDWQPLRIWPHLPKTEKEFWLYLLHHAGQVGWKVPEFLKDLPGLDGVRESLRRWERSRRIDRWRDTLRNFAAGEPEPLGPDPTTPSEVDLRLCIGDIEAWFEWRPPGETKFYRMRQNSAERLVREQGEGLLYLCPEAELLLDTLRGEYDDLVLELGYRDNLEDITSLGRLLRQPALESRIVCPDGTPVARPSEPLRWELTPPTRGDGDYELRLCQSGGEPIPHLLCVLPGRSPLYLTPKAVFRGPALPRHTLDPGSPTIIPAVALETADGLRFLDHLGLPTPARIEERITKVPMSVVITAALQARYIGSKTESCALRVTASDAEGKHLHHYLGELWAPQTESRKQSPRGKVSDQIIVLDRSAMRQVPALMAASGGRWDGLAECFFVRVTKKFPEEFLAWLQTVPPEIQVRLEGELASLTNAAISGSVSLEVSEAEIDWFDLRVVVDVSDTTLTPAEVKLLLAAKGGFVRLGDKGWRRLTFNLTEEEDERLARLGLTPHELSDEPQRLHALQLADGAARKFLPAEQAESIERRASEIKARVTPDLPATIVAQLRPYQVEGFHFLAYLATNHFGGILADDMGLGKTLQTLAWLVWLRSRPEEPAAASQPSLVVCPKSVMDNWRAEAERFAPGLRVRIWHGDDLKRLTEVIAEADLHVLNYAQLRQLGETLVNHTWLAVVLDEGQYIKNPNSQTAQVARALKARHRLVLTGTPIENRLLDLWSLMAFAMPGALGSRALFQRAFDAKEDPFARRRLASRVRPFLLRRTKSQVARDLPDRVEEDLFCEIEGEQVALYRAELKRAQQMLLKVNTQKQLNEMRFNFLTSLLRLRQICCHPKLVKPDTKAASAKVEALLEQLEPLMEEGQKVLVFSQFVELLHLLRPVLEERGWPVLYLAGETENRGELVADFQSREGAAVFLISLRAGGFGLNLTAASYVVLFDPWWNPAVESQAIDRTHRIGQVNKVIAYRLLIKDTIEEKIRALQRRKSALAEDVLGEEKFAQALTLDDLRFLLSD